MNNLPDFRNPVAVCHSLAFGDSHTWGVGVEANQAWPNYLEAMNCGVRAASSDLVVRIAEPLIKDLEPTIVYCLWPHWSRFEYVEDGQICQSLPTDNRAAWLHTDEDPCRFMQDHDDQWCKENFAQNLVKLKNICHDNNCRLIDMTLYDLIPYIDHADRWPVTKLGHHYTPEWHGWVADLFQKARDQNLTFPLAYE